ncbi:MAG: hypothetical protein MI725_01850, partial [Pirellulales bacterium]|nr:hypothetical protein [Pirellulales bacterium]
RPNLIGRAYTDKMKQPKRANEFFTTGGHGERWEVGGDDYSVVGGWLGVNVGLVASGWWLVVRRLLDGFAVVFTNHQPLATNHH